MAKTTKRPSPQDGNQALQGAYNDVDSSFTTNGFLVGKLGHKIIMTISTTSIADDTETYNFFDGANALYEITVIYTDGTRDVILSAERTV